MYFLRGFLAGCIISVSVILLIVAFADERVFSFQKFVCSSYAFALLSGIVVCIGILYGSIFQFISWLSKRRGRKGRLNR